MTTTWLLRGLLRRQAHPGWTRSRPGPNQKHLGQRRAQSTDNKPHNQQGNTAKTGPDPLPTPNTTVPTATPPPPPIWQRLGPLTRAAYSYAHAQRTRPYLTQFLSALIIYFFADLSAQRMRRPEPHDPARTLRSLVIGGLSAIPSYRWFIFLSQNFNYASTRVGSLAVKIVVNQVCFTPLFNTYFFGAQVLLAGEPLARAVERVRRTVPDSIVNSCKLWPAVTAFSFTFVPMEYRSVFSGVIAVGWQTYLSYLNRVAEEAEMAAGEEGAPAVAARERTSSSQPRDGGEVKIKA